MRTSASYMFDGANTRACVSLSSVTVEEKDTANIEFSDSTRKHYIRISGLTPKVCIDLANSLRKFAKKKGRGTT